MTTYKSLYEMLDQCQYILANSLEAGLKDLENFALYGALVEWNEQYNMRELMKWHKGNFNLDEHQEEFEKLCDKYPEKSLDKCWCEMSEELQLVIANAIADSDYPDIYQTFVIDEQTYEILKDYGQFVYHNEDIDLHFWGVMHYGTSWSYVMGDVMPIDNKEAYTK